MLARLTEAGIGLALGSRLERGDGVVDQAQLLEGLVADVDRDRVEAS